MIIALPCIHFSVKEREIINKYGFLSFPQFLDNHYVKYLHARPSWLIKNIEKYGDLVKFAIAPDYLYDIALALKNKYDNVNWIFPLHRKSEVKYAIQFDWVGFPHRPAFRDYSIGWFLDTFKDKKLWYLGFWKVTRPEILLIFNGFDTTIPETYSGKFGKIWLSWKKAIKPKKPMKTIEMFEINVRNFKEEINKLLKQKQIWFKNYNPRGV